LKSRRKSLSTLTEGCYAARVKTLVCPHCASQVSVTAQVCARCGAEIVRGATRRERSIAGLLFAFVAFVVASIALRALELQNGSPVLRPSAESALPFFLGLIAILVVGYMIGKGVACLFRRSKVRFFRSYRH
jgi:hypothetical protein